MIKEDGPMGDEPTGDEPTVDTALPVCVVDADVRTRLPPGTELIVGDSAQSRIRHGPLLPPRDVCPHQAAFNGDDCHAYPDLNHVLGPSGPKEILMPEPVERGSGRSAWTVLAAFATVGVALLVMSQAKWSPDSDATSPEPAPAPEPTAVVKTEPPPAPAPIVVPPKAEPTVVPPKAAPAPEPTVAPTVAKAEPPPAPKTAPPKAEPDLSTGASAKVEPAPVALTISSMGPTPSCTAECTWGNLTESGFPKTVNGTRTVECQNGRVWHLPASSTVKVETGPQKRCWTTTVNAAADEDPIGP